MTWKVLVTCPHLQKTIDLYRERLAQQGVEVEVPPVVQQLSESELLEIIERFDGVIAGDDPFTAKVLENGKRLKIVAKWGIGMDAIDQEAARKLGIQVKNTPDVFPNEVADVVVGYLVMLSRKLHQLDRAVRRGEWQQIQGQSLQGKTLGVVGIGSIGRAVVRRGVMLGMSVVGYDVMPVSQAFTNETGMKAVELEELLQSADFISLNCNLTADNQHMLSRRQFELMKAGVQIINTARGALIDERALVEALDSGKVGGAALDVFEEEPLPSESPLRSFDSCILGTHNSSNTREAVLRVNEMAIDNLLQGLSS
ncbi:phosphoglycerate dehydrogenase [Geitlerinema sp. PCC 9228]|uniref:phosphoglycerate dehydrogenase n=1 Tax=Geitlerinema sp. PCC 9228 TaxID=111611 RepID=UPI0008F99C8F|nr:phosphoglycerate dehydrogenase [Geitlerinema sp. PCC 9228]